MSQMHWQDDSDDDAQVVAQLVALRAMPEDTRRELARFLTDDDQQESEPGKDDAAATERWQAAHQQSGPAAGGNAPSVPATSGGLESEIAAERARLRDNPGESWNKYLALKLQSAQQDGAA